MGCPTVSKVESVSKTESLRNIGLDNNSGLDINVELAAEPATDVGACATDVAEPATDGGVCATALLLASKLSSSRKR